MLLSLINAESYDDFSAAFKAVKDSYLNGIYIAGGQPALLPFWRVFKSLFREKDDPYEPYFYPKDTDDVTPPGLPEKIRNVGWYNHMCNVSAAMAHVLLYAEKQIGRFIPEDIENVDRVFTRQRKLDNLHLAYYHDIGKCNTPRRHAFEGKSLFYESKASTRRRFENIFKSYKSKTLSLREETIAYYAELIGAHDIFGTISTGENGLLSLSGVISRLAVIFNYDIKKTKTSVVDLWLLTIADIIVSVPLINGKTQEELDWGGHLPGKNDENLDAFFESEKGRNLRDDLIYAFDIADAALNGKPDVYSYAKVLSEKLAVFRIKRLARETLGIVLENNAVFPLKIKNKIIDKLESDGINGDIDRILNVEFGENYRQIFGTMLQFDYALRFFREIAGIAVGRINDELKGGKFRTGWVLIEKSAADKYSGNFKADYNAECILNNYLTMLAGIFGEISRLTGDIEHWNIEFDDAANRLDGIKIERLLCFGGVYLASNARNLLMREIMLYKS